MTQGSNLHFLHWQADYLPLSHQGSPEMSVNIIKWFLWGHIVLHMPSWGSLTHALKLAGLVGFFISRRPKSTFIMTFKFLEIKYLFFFSLLHCFYQLYFFPIFSLKSSRISWYFQNIPCVLLYKEPTHSSRFISPASFLWFFSWFSCASIALLQHLVLCSLLLICGLLLESKNCFPLIFVHPILSTVISLWWSSINT